MSRRSKSGRSRRDTSDIANFQLPLPMSFTSLSDYEDRRQFYPAPVTPARDIFGSAAKIKVGRPKNGPTQLSFKRALAALQFSAPKEVVVCVKRKVRKEVLHALGKSGKTGQKKPRRNYFSDVRC